MALPVLPGPLGCAEAFCQSFLAIPVALPSLPGLLPGLRFLPGYPGLAFPCRALPVHPGPVTGASWPPMALPGCPGFAFLAFPCFCQAAKTWQHDGGHPADEFFRRQQRKRTVFDQTLAEAFLLAKPGHMKLCFYTPGCPPRAYRCKTRGIAGPAEGRRPTQTGRGHSNLVAFPCFLCFSA